MFGYILPALGALTAEQRDQYQAYYCGLCRTLNQRHGSLGRMTLSNDMTFLLILLSSLYEPEEVQGKKRCAPHPIRARAYAQNEFSAYCADMNVALAYHKALDDWQDDRKLLGRAQAGLLKAAYQRVESLYPDKCMAIESCLKAIGAAETADTLEPDKPANLTARMLGTIFRFREDRWSDTLWEIGEALGRFIYFMDAYDDLAADLKRGRFNPLREYAKQEDYEALCHDFLTMLIAEATQAFETLPLVKDAELLRNVLYAGVWSRYEAKQRKESGS